MKQISRIVARASLGLEAWRLRRLEGRKYKFLYVDGANFAVRINGRVSRQSFCAVLGVSEEGLALELGIGNGRIYRKRFSQSAGSGIQRRGCGARHLDGLPGLEGLFKKFFPRAQTQRRQKHAKARVCRQVREAERDEFSKGVNQIFYARNESGAKLFL